MTLHHIDCRNRILDVTEWERRCRVLRHAHQSRRTSGWSAARCGCFQPRLSKGPTGPPNPPLQADWQDRCRRGGSDVDSVGHCHRGRRVCPARGVVRDVTAECEFDPCLHVPHRPVAGHAVCPAPDLDRDGVLWHLLVPLADHGAVPSNPAFATTTAVGHPLVHASPRSNERSPGRASAPCPTMAQMSLRVSGTGVLFASVMLVVPSAGAGVGFDGSAVAARVAAITASRPSSTPRPKPTPSAAAANTTTSMIAPAAPSSSTTLANVQPSTTIAPALPIITISGDSVASVVAGRLGELGRAIQRGGVRGRAVGKGMRPASR